MFTMTGPEPMIRPVRTLFRASCLLLTLFAAGCGAWPNETRIVSRNWAHPKLNQNAGPSYCYKTLADVQCTAAPQPEPAAGRLEGAYSTKHGPTVNGTPPPEIYRIQKRKKGWFARGYARNSARPATVAGSGQAGGVSGTTSNAPPGTAATAATASTTGNDWGFLSTRKQAGATSGGSNGGVEFKPETQASGTQGSEKPGKGPRPLQ